jgi:hypothetical protein
MAFQAIVKDHLITEILKLGTEREKEEYRITIDELRMMKYEGRNKKWSGGVME